MTSKMHLLIEREDKDHNFLIDYQVRTMAGKIWYRLDYITQMFGSPSRYTNPHNITFLYWVLRYKKDGRLIGLSVSPSSPNITHKDECFTIWVLDGGNSNIYYRLKKGINQGLKYLAVNTKQWQCVECGQVVIANYKPELNFNDFHECDFSLLINKI